jgi:hypothetical protein
LNFIVFPGFDRSGPKAISAVSEQMRRQRVFQKIEAGVAVSPEAVRTA